MQRRFLSAALLGVGLLALAGAQASTAQAPAHSHQHDAAAGAATAGPEDGLTAKAREQLARARRVASAFATPEAARAAGYVPVFGHIRLQGEHWVRTDLVEGGRFDVDRPPVLMFAPVDGKQALVGAAYAYLQPARAPMPEGFDGTADVWHTHDDLVHVPGKRLVMTHVWLVDAPGGPFARYNPWLPLLEAGIAPPPTDDAAAHGLAMALTLATEPELAALVRHHAGPELRAKIETHRQAVQALVPGLKAARQQGDAAGFGRLAAEAGGHADAILALCREAAPSPQARRAFDRAVAELLAGEHPHAGHGH